MPIRALIEVLSTIEAGLPRIGNSAWIRKYGPFTLMSKVRFQPGRIGAGDDHPGALGDEPMRRLQPDAGRAACDKRGFIG